jgi:hypothetical protein
VGSWRGDRLLGHPERSLLPARHAYNPPKSLNRLLRVDTGAAATLKGNNGANSLGYLSLGGLSGKLEQAGALEIRQDQDIFGSARGVVNTGAITKAQGIGETIVQPALSQPGTLNVDTGRLKTDNLQDYSAASKTLGGGTYNLTGTLALPNADVVTNAATLALKGSGAQVDNSSTGAADDGLDNLRSNAASGHVRVLDGKSLTAPKASSPGPFTNTGTLTVGDASTFTATGGLQNNGTLQGSEAFDLNLPNVSSNATLGDSSGRVTIVDDDEIPPETTITSGPSGTVRSTTASVAFKSSEPEAGSFECRRDGGSWSACASPAGYSALGQGAHTFEVRAIDGEGTVGPTPDKRSWTVDTSAPRSRP